MQISIQSPDAEENDRIAGNRSFEKKIAAAGVVKELDFPLTINCVLHRHNLDRIEELLDLALDLGAQRLELANTQYYLGGRNGASGHLGASPARGGSVPIACVIVSAPGRRPLCCRIL